MELAKEASYVSGVELSGFCYQRVGLLDRLDIMLLSLSHNPFVVL